MLIRVLEASSLYSGKDIQDIHTGSCDRAQIIGVRPTQTFLVLVLGMLLDPAERCQLSLIQP